MKLFAFRPNRITRTGDDSPASSLLRYVWRMSGRHQIAVCLLALAVAGLSMLPIALQKRLVDDAIGGGSLRLLALLTLAYLAVLLLQAALKYALRLYQGWLSESATRYCRAHLAERHAARREAGEAGEQQGQAVSVITSEIDVLGGFVGEGLSQPAVNLGMLLAIAGYMLAVEPLVAGLSFLLLLPQALLVPLIQRRINRLLERRVGLIRRLSDRISQSEEPEAGQDEDAEATPFDRLLDRIFGNRMAIFAAKFAMKGLVNLMNAMAPLTVLAVGGYFVIQGQTSIGVVVAFMSGFDRRADPLRDLLSYYRFAAQALVQHRMIARWM